MTTLGVDTAREASSGKTRAQWETEHPVLFLLSPQNDAAHAVMAHDPNPERLRQSNPQPTEPKKYRILARASDKIVKPGAVLTLGTGPGNHFVLPTQNDYKEEHCQFILHPKSEELIVRDLSGGNTNVEVSIHAEHETTAPPSHFVIRDAGSSRQMAIPSLKDSRMTITVRLGSSRGNNSKTADFCFTWDKAFSTPPDLHLSFTKAFSNTVQGQPSRLLLRAQALHYSAKNHPILPLAKPLSNPIPHLHWYDYDLKYSHEQISYGGLISWKLGRALDLQTGGLYCIKYPKQYLDREELDMRREIAFFEGDKKLKHDNILEVFQLEQDPTTQIRRAGSLITDGFDMTLEVLIVDAARNHYTHYEDKGEGGCCARPSLDERPEWVPDLVEDLVSVLKYTHARKITHRNISPATVAVRLLLPHGGSPPKTAGGGHERKFSFLLKDFGSAVDRTEKAPQVTSATYLPAAFSYEPPESRMSSAGRESEKFDLWQFGVLMLEATSLVCESESTMDDRLWSIKLGWMGIPGANVLKPPQAVPKVTGVFDIANMPPSHPPAGPRREGEAAWNEQLRQRWWDRMDGFAQAAKKAGAHSEAPKKAPGAAERKDLGSGKEAKLEEPWRPSIQPTWITRFLFSNPSERGSIEDVHMEEYIKLDKEQREAKQAGARPTAPVVPSVPIRLPVGGTHR
ncbi:hypothetical protein B0T26DRAFT_300760 [Lasiosphaeria miniovina]|uniref:Protein kinase domain-containing protein n=1 Tax=Lasiosphaeria miniovina TaxID=1954250 RepID=A0AA40DV94_9PEZI|nr:uncharacterized protein B0T26DRAFT_300760 [Lasiosphaeria miniovina]KAK0717649.1 hypothetical protein B0T26DRAFT_300760 [Lasiosphaeria miniovina]